jgi:hypothetical protein
MCRLLMWKSAEKRAARCKPTLSTAMAPRTTTFCLTSRRSKSGFRLAEMTKSSRQRSEKP